MKEYSRQQLALRNGQGREEIWVAHKGYIYDEFHSRLWRDDKYYEHGAGQDLTSELDDAPHDSNVLKNYR